MPSNTNTTCELNRFEKNNYFYGKLLTVRDMAVEQSYHTRVRRTLSRFVSDYGAVCGLGVDASVVTPDSGEGKDLSVTVTPGLALDRCGRLVLVEEPVDLEMEVPPDGNEPAVGVYVEYDECFTEPVPAAKAEHACEDECVENRVVETADVTLEAGDPDVAPKSVADVRFNDSEEYGVWPGAGGRRDIPEEFIDDSRERIEIPKGPIRFAGQRDPERAAEPTVDLDLRGPGGEVVYESWTVEDDEEGYWTVEADLTDSDLEVGQGVRIVADNSVSRYRVEAQGEVVDPEESGDEPGELTDDDLADLARSYYEREPRRPRCPDQEEGPLLLGVVRPEDDDGSWDSVEFERGPLVYTNDLLYDILARHVSDFENPHEVGLGLEEAMASGGRQASTVEVGVREPDDLTGSIGLWSSDGSVDISADLDSRTVDFSGVRSQYETYLLVEKSMWNKLNAFTDLLGIYYRRVASGGGGENGEEDEQTSEQVIAIRSMAIVLRTGSALSDDVHDDPQSYAEFLTGEPSLEEIMGEEIPEEFPDEYREALEKFFGAGRSIVDLEADVSEEIDIGFIPHPGLLEEAIQQLRGVVDQTSDPVSDARDLAVAQDRVAEAVRGIAGFLTGAMQGIGGGGPSGPGGGARAMMAETASPEGADPGVEAGFGGPVANLSSAFGPGDLDVSELRPIVDELVGSGIGLPTDVVGEPLHVATNRLRTAGLEYTVEAEQYDDPSQLEDRQVGEVIEQHESAGEGDPDVVLTVLAAPSVERIDGVGDARGQALGDVGAGTVPELATASPEYVAEVAGVSETTAANWIETADRYASAYDLTSVVGIGVDEAEAIVEAVEVTSPDELAEYDLSKVVNEASRQAEAGDLADRHATALREMDIDLVESNL